MFQPQTIDLVYVGSKKFKVDNVCNTGTVWIGYGDVQKVERKHAPKFLLHPDVWLTAEEFEKKESTSGLAGYAHLLGKTDGGTSALTGPATTANVNDYTIVPQASGAGLADAPKTDVPTDTLEDDDKSDKKGDELLAIKNAILSLEQGNAAHFSSTNGVPIVSAVRTAANDQTVTAADVRAAWAELNGKAE